MGFIHTLDGFSPVPRLDGQPFVSMQLEESADRVASSVIATQALVPVDVDPRYPAARGITSDQATLERCWLRITFLDAQGDMSRSDWVWSQASATGLATIDDVRAVLRLRDPALADDADLARVLAVAASWLEPKLRTSYSATGGVIQEFHERADEVVRLPVPGAAVTQVAVWYADTSAPSVLTSGIEYLVTSSGVRLYGQRYPVGDLRYAPVDVGIRSYPRVEVTWTSAASVPEALREGVALFAASLWATLPKLSSGMRSERIGDYSYTLGDKDVDEALPPKAAALLKPFMRRKLPFVV